MSVDMLAAAVLLLCVVVIAFSAAHVALLTCMFVLLQMQRTLILLLAGLVVASAQPFQPGQNLAPLGRVLVSLAFYALLTSADHAAAQLLQN